MKTKTPKKLSILDTLALWSMYVLFALFAFLGFICIAFGLGDPAVKTQLVPMGCVFILAALGTDWLLIKPMQS
jgi:uncharacterized membrane protein YqjE